MPTTWTDHTTTSYNYIYVEFASGSSGGMPNYMVQQTLQRRALQRFTKEAIDKAHKLLCRHLTEEQRQTLADHGWFVVQGGMTKRKFRIRKSPHLIANIDLLGMDDIVVARYCGHAELGDMPIWDHLLTQKLMLEHAEDDFFAIANEHPIM